MKRRSFLKMLGYAPAVAAVPAIAKGLPANEAGGYLVKGNVASAIKTPRGNFVKPLWPGLEKYYKHFYEDHVYEYKNLFDDQVGITSYHRGIKS